VGTEINETNESPLSAEERQTGQAAFEQLLPRLRDIADDRISWPRINLRLAAIAAVGVANRVKEPAVRAVFSTLPEDKFNMALLDLLEPAAFAASFAYQEMATAEALATNAKLSAKLASEASTVRERMLKLVDFHLGDEEEIREVVADIRAGTGYVDTGSDLSRLAKLYRENLEVLSRDPTHYVASDPDSAERMAGEIDRELGAGPTSKERQQREIVARAWTVLNDTYEQIARPGRWLFHDKGGDKMFPSLVSAGRRRRARSSAKAGEKVTDPT
jgi:hypothetical protein